MLMWEDSKSWASHAALISGWTTKHARRILEEVVWSGSSESQFRSTYFRYACLTESKSRGFWVAHSASWKKNIWQCFLFFVRENRWCSHFLQCLRYRVKEPGFHSAICNKGVLERLYILLRKHGDRIPWRNVETSEVMFHCFICILSDLTPRWASDICFLLTLLNWRYSALAGMIRPSSILVSEQPFWLNFQIQVTELNASYWSWSRRCSYRAASYPLMTLLSAKLFAHLWTCAHQELTRTQ